MFKNPSRLRLIRAALILAAPLLFAGCIVGEARPGVDYGHVGGGYVQGTYSSGGYYDDGYYGPYYGPAYAYPYTYGPSGTIIYSERNYYSPYPARPSHDHQHDGHWRRDPGRRDDRDDRRWSRAPAGETRSSAPGYRPSARDSAAAADRERSRPSSALVREASRPASRESFQRPAQPAQRTPPARTRSQDSDSKDRWRRG